MKKKLRKGRKTQLFIIASLFVVFGILVVIQYFHFRGIKYALEHLVDEKTKGQYKLDLGETKYDFIRLDFSLKNAHIYRIDTLSDQRIYTVELPAVRINLGSLESYFSFGQINVKEFEIEEPIILLRKSDRDREEIVLSSELARLLEIINEILDSFNIHSFRIIKGAFDVSGKDQQLRVNLIDFLAQEWNVRRLTAESQIAINVGGQQIRMGEHDFSFGQIEYNYQERQLIVSDFSYHHLDSDTGADLYAKGDTFIIYHVDWQELSSTERYKLKRIELVRPDIRGSFPLPKGKRKDNDFFRMLHSTVGDLLVDSLIVREARVHLSYKQKTDSTSFTFRNANFSVTDFQLLNSKEFFQVNEVRFNLSKTELVIGKNYRLMFDSLFFNRQLHHRLRIRNLELSQYRSRKPFFRAEHALVSSFNPFEFMMNKRIHADAVVLDDVALTLLPELFTSKHEAQENEVQIDVGRLELSHANIYYAHLGREFAANDLHVRFNRITLGKSRRPSFLFDQFTLKKLTYRDDEGNEANAKSILLSDRHISARSLDASQANGLTFSISRIGADFDPFTYKVPDHITSIETGSMRVSGTVKNSKKNQRFAMLNIDRMSTDTLTASVNTPTSQVKFQALRVAADGIVLDTISSHWHTVEAMVNNFSFENTDWKVTAKKSWLNSMTGSEWSDVRVLKKDSTVVFQAESLFTSAFHGEKDIAKIKLLSIHFKGKSDQTSVQGMADSLVVEDIVSAPKPLLNKVLVFHPVMNVSLSEKKSIRVKKHLDLPQEIKELIVHQADITINKKSSPIFAYHLNASWHQGLTPDISMDSMILPTEKNRFAAKQLKLNAERLYAGSLSILPTQSLHDYSTSAYEKDRIVMQFNEIKASGFLFDSLMYGQQLDVGDLQIGSFQIDALRDKRLPDGPYQEKQLFSGMLKAIRQQVNFPAIHFTNGTITIHQVSEKTLETGTLVFSAVAGDLRNINTMRFAESNAELSASAKAYGQGSIRVNYKMQNNNRFKLDVAAEDLDLLTFNQIVQPIQSIRFKSGTVKSFEMNAEGGDSLALGNARITYSDARIEIQDANHTNFRNDIVSAIANEVIRNRRKNFGAPFTQERDSGKSEFAYWVKMVLKGASTAARKGKKQK